MTREEKKQILEDVLERAYAAVRDTSTEQLAWPDCRTLLKNIDLMEGMVKYMLADFPEPIHKPAQPETEGTGVAEPQNQEAPDAPAPEPPGTETPVIKMEEVRAALAKARGKGVNVAEIIRGFGVDTFPQIDKTQYPAVLAKLEEALNA